MHSIVKNFISDGPAVISLCNPPVNALSIDLVKELHHTLLYFSTPACDKENFKYLKITGGGSLCRHFSAGADLKERALMDKRETLEFISELNKVFNLLESIEIPTIAVIEGATLGGGAELALCCDFIAVKKREPSSKDFKIGFPETTIGIIPGAGGTYRILKKMNMSIAKRWILSGKTFSLKEAIKDGFVDFDSDQLLKFEQCLLSNSRTSLIAAKASIDKCYLEIDRKKQRLIELEEYKKTLDSSERAETLKKYKKK